MNYQVFGGALLRVLGWKAEARSLRPGCIRGGSAVLLLRY